MDLFIRRNRFKIAVILYFASCSTFVASSFIIELNLIVVLFFRVALPNDTALILLVRVTVILLLIVMSIACYFGLSLCSLLTREDTLIRNKKTADMCLVIPFFKVFLKRLLLFIDVFHHFEVLVHCLLASHWHYLLWNSCVFLIISLKCFVISSQLFIQHLHWLLVLQYVDQPFNFIYRKFELAYLIILFIRILFDWGFSVS